MMTHAYNQLYLRHACQTFGHMLHVAVVIYGLDGDSFLYRFQQSGIAKEFECGSPRFIAGLSGTELFYETMSATSGLKIQIVPSATVECSPEYWAGWMLAQYQWYSGRSFSSILEVISYGDLLGLYKTLHEADVHKSYEVLDAHFEGTDCKLKKIRKLCRLTQQELSEASGVSVNTIRAYEQKSKDLNKGQVSHVQSLARALKCELQDLLD